MAFEVLEGPSGQPVTAKGDADGAQLVAISGGVTVAGGATEAGQDAGNASLADIDTNTDGLEAGQTTTNAKLDTR